MLAAIFGFWLWGHISGHLAVIAVLSAFLAMPLWFGLRWLFWERRHDRD